MMRQNQYASPDLIQYMRMSEMKEKNRARMNTVYLTMNLHFALSLNDLVDSSYKTHTHTNKKKTKCSMHKRRSELTSEPSEDFKMALHNRTLRVFKIYAYMQQMRVNIECNQKKIEQYLGRQHRDWSDSRTATTLDFWAVEKDSAPEVADMDSC